MNSILSSSSLCRWLPLLLAVIIFHAASWALYDFTPELTPDSGTYIRPAKMMLEDGSFANYPGAPETKRTPGYPLLISISLGLGMGLPGVVLLQHLMCIGIMGATGYLARKQGGDTTALIASGLVGLSCLLTLYANMILSEILFTFIITFGFLLLATIPPNAARPHLHIASAALLFGVSTLIRPIALFLPLPALLYLLFRLKRQRLGHCLIFLIVFSIIPGSWMARNHTHVGEYTLSSISDINLLGYTATGALALKQGGDFAQVHEEIKQRLLAEANEEFHAQPLDSTRTIGDIYRYKAMLIIKENPGYIAQHIIRNVSTTLLGNGTTHIAKLTGISHGTAQLLSLAYTIPTLCLALYGLWVCWRKDKPFALLAFLYAGYFIGIAAVGGVGGSRFRLPVEPILCLHIALAIMDIKQRLYPSEQESE